MILVFDTETTALPNSKLPADHPEQARICQIACILLDESYKEVNIFSSLIKPAGWVISTGAQAAHHITQNQCEQFGVDIRFALYILESFSTMSVRHVAHNFKFDEQLIDIEETLIGSRAFMLNSVCTMETMTPICKLPSRFPNGKYKWPKLSEAYKHVTNQELSGAHDALNDVRATATIYRWLVENKHIN